MCLSQPDYINRCNTAIASQYRIRDEDGAPVVLDEVTITAEEVSVKQTCSREWTTFYKIKPALISKQAIDSQKKYKPEDQLSIWTPPRIEIDIKKIPVDRDSDPLELKVEGLNREAVFQVSPEFFNSVVDTDKIKTAMEELGEEIKGQSLECSDYNILSIATQMLKHMECIEGLLQSRDPLSVSNTTLHMLQEMEAKSRLLKDVSMQTLRLLKVSFDMEIHIEAVNSFSVQLRVLYAANINPSLKSGNTSEWHAATSLFIANAANLMRSIKDVLTASKSAQELAHNHSPTSQVTPQNPTHGCTSSVITQNLPQPSTSMPQPSTYDYPPLSSVQAPSPHGYPPSPSTPATTPPRTHGYPLSPSAQTPTTYGYPPAVPRPSTHGYLPSPSAQAVPQPSTHGYPPSPSAHAQATPQLSTHGYPPSQAVPQPSTHCYPPSPSAQAVPQPSTNGYPPSPFTQAVPQPSTHGYPPSPSAQAVPQPSTYGYPPSPSTQAVPQPSTHGYPPSPSAQAVPQSSPHGYPPAQATLQLSTYTLSPQPSTHDYPLSPHAQAQSTPPSPSAQAMPQPSTHGYPPSPSMLQPHFHPLSPAAQATPQPSTHGYSPSAQTTSIHGYLPSAEVQSTHGYPPSAITYSSSTQATLHPLYRDCHWSSPKPLRIEDMGVVYRSLYPLTAKWRTIGVFLCINHGSLDVIKADNESSDDRLMALIALWLKRNTPAATWQALYEAVQYIDPNQAQWIRGKADGSDSTVVEMQHPCSDLAHSV